MGSLVLLQRHDLHILCNVVGSLLIVAGFVGLVPIAVCFAFGETFAIPAFLLGSVVSLFLGLALYLPFSEEREIRLKHGMIAAAVSWLVIPLIGGIPFAVMGELLPPNSGLVSNMTFLEGYFESMSGWTTTGLTMVINEELLPRCIQFWRSLTQWVGGLGVVVFVLVILVKSGSGAYSLYAGEGRTDRLEPRIVSTARQILKIYAVYTLLAILVFYTLGMPVWDSINHAMTTLSTGGFSVADQSIGSYDSLLLEIAVMCFMLVGAISFAVHHEVFKRHFRALTVDIQVRALLIVCVLGIGLLTADLWLKGPISGALRSPRFSSFQFIAALSTTGFQTADVGGWTPSARLILSMAMIVGGSAGATVGGMKLIRLILLVKGAHWRFLKTFLPKGMYVPRRVGDATLSETEFSEDVLEAATLTFLYLALLAVGILVIVSVTDAPLRDAIFEVCSAQGTVGLSVGVTGPHLSAAGKCMLILNMWIGRLEIFPALVLLQSMGLSLMSKKRS